MINPRRIRNSRPAVSVSADDLRPSHGLALVRRCLPALLAIAVCVVSAPAAFAQAPQAGKGEPKALQTRDGATIRVTYFPAKGGKESPVVVLLPPTSGNRIVYDRILAPRLQAQDMAVITVDPRLHGESSGGPSDPNNQSGKQGRLTPNVIKGIVVEDLEAVKRFIFDEHQAGRLNMAKLGLVSATSGVPIAVAYAEFDWAKPPYDDAPIPAARTPRGQDVKAIVMISPETNTPGIPLNRSLGNLINRNYPISFLMLRGESDPDDRGQSRRVMQQLSSLQKPGNDTPPQALEGVYQVKLRGTDLLGKNLPIEQHIVGFLDKNLKQLNIPWRDRQSPLVGN